MNEPIELKKSLQVELTASGEPSSVESKPAEVGQIGEIVDADQIAINEATDTAKLQEQVEATSGIEMLPTPSPAFPMPVVGGKAVTNPAKMIIAEPGNPRFVAIRYNAFNLESATGNATNPADPTQLRLAA